MSEAFARRDTYFRELDARLRVEGPGTPVALIDLDRLDRNCERLRASIAPGKQLRIVAKSLPSVPMLRYVMARTGSTRLMSFHAPFLARLVREIPEAHVLLGKPMPVRAVEVFYEGLDPGGRFDPRTQLAWLIDSRARLLAYQRLARRLGTRMCVCVEIDVGLHRGGLSSPDELDALIAIVTADPEHLRFAGFMGYDAHVGRLPTLIERPATTLAKVQARYRAFVERARSHGLHFDGETVMRNGAGSPTFRLHGEDSPIDDVAVGSALLKPLDFDLDALVDFEPAVFLATPVLKVVEDFALPGAERWSRPLSQLDPRRARTFFLYGGRFMARYEWPAGLIDDPLYGSSTNQTIVHAPREVRLEVDEHVFLRPTQSEAVLLQFGDLLAMRGGRIEARWPVLSG